MKLITGRIAYKEFDQFWGSCLSGEPLFDSKSILWRINLPGVAGLAVFRGLLRKAAVEQGEERFPYSQVAETLLRQQMAVFGGWRAPRRCTPRQWRDGVLIDQGVRALLPMGKKVRRYSPKAIYREYLRFAQAMGLRTEHLPSSVNVFNMWAMRNVADRKDSDCRRRALGCITNLSPIFWPANIAVIFYLLPVEFWEAYGINLGTECRRLAICAERVITNLSCSKPEK